ncbi:MAG: hypothetical protein RJA25_1855 [Bacteroidota bacterium]|jgi:6-pyruvoyltetrahydropterin/6-carboxytetrahydropterin synthase
MEIYKEFRFEAAHFLPNVGDNHPCKNIHGHSYRVKLSINGELDPEIGWVMDFTDIKDVFTPILNQLDHSMLNNIEGLENPTCEKLAVWIWDKMKPLLPLLSKIEVNETTSSGCIYRGK